MRLAHCGTVWAEHVLGREPPQGVVPARPRLTQLCYWGMLRMVVSLFDNGIVEVDVHGNSKPEAACQEYVLDTPCSLGAATDG